MKYLNYKTFAILVFLIIASISFFSKAQSYGADNKVDSVNIYEAPFVFKSLKSSEAPFFTKKITSPDKLVELLVEVSENGISYSVSKNGELILDKSGLDLQLKSGNIVSGLGIEDSNITEIQEELTIPYGERAFVENHCHELVIRLINSVDIRFELIFRVYNQGVGFRFKFPKENAIPNIYVQNEYSQFCLADNYNVYNETYNERGYHTTSIENVRSLIPLTLSGSNNFLSINEAGNDSFARIALQGAGNTLQTYFIGSRSSHPLPYHLPWRYVLIGDDENELIKNKDILYSLNDDDFDASQWLWVKPGKVFRCLDLTTEGAKEAIEFCVGLDIEYMMFDAGWYGLGYGQSNEKDPDSNPMDVIDGLDMLEVTDYAKDKGVGIILYINKVAWYNYDNQAMFDLYESWGISGLKLGFMDGYSSYGIRRIYDIIREAAKRKMLVNVHDNFRPTGMVRKYPNLLTAEGVRGNEYVTNTGDHTTLLPYTRMLSGATDYTICYKGNDPDYPSKLMDNVTTKGHQLAMSIVNYSPLQHVMWYGRPYIYEKPVETELFSFLPTIWDDSKVQIGEIGEVYSIARKKGNNWFLATINDTREKEISVPLSFLEDGKDYIITTYEDSDSESIEKTEGDLAFFESAGKIIDNAMLIKLGGNGGQVAIFKELNDPTFSEEAGIDLEMTLYPNPADDFVFLELNDTSFSKAQITLFSMEGKKLFIQELFSTNGVFRVDVASVPSGVYFVMVETLGRKFQEIILLK